MSVKITATSLADMGRFFEQFPEMAEQAAVMSLNQVVEREAVPMMRDEAYNEVNYPSGYLNREDRFKIKKKARRGDLEVVMAARDQPTSLARFVTSQDKRGFRIQVSKKSAGSRMVAFYTNLRRGNSGALGNRGLAIRVKGTAEPDKAYRPKKLFEDKNGTVWLLYGPSVDQVMAGVFDDVAGTIAEKIDREFTRQYLRLGSRG